MSAHDANDSPGDEHLTVPQMEEVATVSKRERVTGRVRVSTTVEAFEEVVRSTLRSDAVEVTRVAIGRPVDVAPAVRTEGDVTIVPVLEEVLVIEKRLMLKEELHIRRTTRTDAVEEPVTLRRQTAIVERFEAPAGHEVDPPA